jgi:hypothetical protein
MYRLSSHSSNTKYAPMMTNAVISMPRPNKVGPKLEELELFDSDSLATMLEKPTIYN